MRILALQIVSLVSCMSDSQSFCRGFPIVQIAFAGVATTAELDV